MTSHPYAGPQLAWGQATPAPHPELRGAQILAVLSVLLSGPIGAVLAVLALRRVADARRDILASGGRWEGMATANVLRIVGWLGLVLSILVTLMLAAQLLLAAFPS